MKLENIYEGCVLCRKFGEGYRKVKLAGKGSIYEPTTIMSCISFSPEAEPPANTIFSWAPGNILLADITLEWHEI